MHARPLLPEALVPFPFGLYQLEFELAPPLIYVASFAYPHLGPADRRRFMAQRAAEVAQRRALFDAAIATPMP